MTLIILPGRTLNSVACAENIWQSETNLLQINCWNNFRPRCCKNSLTYENNGMSVCQSNDDVWRHHRKKVDDDDDDVIAQFETTLVDEHEKGRNRDPREL